MVKTILISSKKDPAGTLIHEEVSKLLNKNNELLTDIIHWYAEERLIYLNGPDLPSCGDRILFLSRHASERPRPVMTVHVTGNFGPADYGGLPSTLTPAATDLMHALINGLVRYAPSGYEVMYEATHHGPTDILLPSCFVEIGSTEKEWHDRNGAFSVALAIVDALKTDTSHMIPLAGFGGTHYTQRQTEISKKTRGGFGHIMPSRDIRYLDERMFLTIVQKSQAIGIYIDGKAIPGEDARKIEKYAHKFHIPIIGQNDLLHLSEMKFSEYLSIRNLAESYLPDSFVVLHDLQACPNPVIISLPSDLVDEVMKALADEFYSYLDTLPIAHISGNGKACHASFITEKSHEIDLPFKLIQKCIILLQSRYTCFQDQDSLIIKKIRFDPKKAQTLGIAPGPQYSELMAGKPIQSADSIIYPEMVMSVDEKRINISYPISQPGK